MTVWPFSITFERPLRNSSILDSTPLVRTPIRLERMKSIAEVARKTLGKAGFNLFIAFTIVMIVLVTQMGVITPPVGVNVYVVSGMERDIPLQTVFQGALPFLVALGVATALIVAFPHIALVLPDMMALTP